jgi:hypothetical protein
MQLSRTPKIEVKKSVFLFLRSVLVVELFFSSLPLLLSYLLDLQQMYEETSSSGSLPFPLLTLLAITVLQVVAVSLAFAAWYYPTYVIYPDHIMHLRSNMFEDRKLAEISEIARVKFKQGWLGQRMNYGTLELDLENNRQRVYLRDIPAPAEIGELIESNMAVSQARPLLPDQIDTDRIIQQGEGQFIEFKASLVWDYYQQRANKELYLPVMKTLVAFMNSRGGILLIGVDDDGSVLGLEKDLQTMRKKSLDGFELAFNAAFNKMIGVPYRQYVNLQFPQTEGKVICYVRVIPSPVPVYLNYQGEEAYYIRAGNASQVLSVSQAAQYILERHVE